MGDDAQSDCGGGMNETRWQRVRDGDGVAFSELFDDYSDLIYNTRSPAQVTQLREIKGPDHSEQNGQS